MNNVLILTQEFDPHVDAVSKKIKSLGGETVLFKRYSENNYLSIFLDDLSTSSWITVDNIRYNLKNDFRSIYFRLKPELMSEIQGASSTVDDRFRMNEWMQLLFSIESFVCSSTLIVNSVTKSSLFSKKPAQLKLAKDCGMLIPDTIFSNNSLDITNKINTNSKEIVYKTLSSFMTEDKVIYTNKIRLEDVSKCRNQISLAPGIFQKLLHKKHELRVYIIRDKIFTIKINSQKFHETSLDWRHCQEEKMFCLGNLSEKTKVNLLKFHRKANLIYAAYDFVVDQDGNEIFLECNLSGQWLFLGDILGEPITEEIAKTLYFGSNNSEKND